jgi:hypothetical protein
MEGGQPTDEEYSWRGGVTSNVPTIGGSLVNKY